MDIDKLEEIQILDSHVNARIQQLKASTRLQYNPEFIISFLDLTSLSAADTKKSIDILLDNAQHPVKNVDVQTASVCVYQPFVNQCVGALKGTNIGVATVSGGFPAGQMDVKVKCADIERSIALGATEIDVVINRSNPLTENWPALFDEVLAFRKAAEDTLLKVILATGDLDDLTRIAKTSWVCMLAGADFIKTSTGMEKVNATYEAGFVMLQMINRFYQQKGRKVGFKPAGGIRKTEDALLWLQLVQEEMGEEWLDKSLFRIGASGLLDDLVASL